MNARGQYGTQAVCADRGQYGHAAFTRTAGFWSELFKPISAVSVFQKAQTEKVKDLISDYALSTCDRAAIQRALKEEIEQQRRALSSPEAPAPSTRPADQARVSDEKSNVGMYIALGIGAVAATAVAVLVTRRVETP